MYKVFAELGRAIKTIFLCRHLESQGLLREINGGLNVVESWNITNRSIFYGYGKAGDLTTNRRDTQ